MFFGTLLLTCMGLTVLHAQEIEQPLDEMNVEEYSNEISESVLSAIESMIASLEAQNAPVPSELIELLQNGSSLETEEDIALFEAQAERYFGEGWQEQIAEDAGALASEKTTLAVRTRIYLSSLIINADQIAKESPLGTEEIRAVGMETMQKAHTMEENTVAFFESLKDTYRQIFPEDDGKDLASFRANVTLLLADIADALVLIVDGREYEGLRADQIGRAHV